MTTPPLPLQLRRTAGRAAYAALPWWRRAGLAFVWWWRRATCAHGVQSPCGPACRLCLVCGAVLLARPRGDWP